MTATFDEDASYEMELKIRQSITNEEPSSKDLSINVLSFCESAGRSKIKVGFDKTVYEASEPATVRVEIDNSRCKSNVQNINIGIRHEFSINIDHYFAVVRSTFKKAWIPGPKAGQGNFVGEIKLDLENIRDTKNDRTKQGEDKVEDQHIEDNLMPYIKTDNVSSQYKLYC